jgi:hypothetical protein
MAKNLADGFEYDSRHGAAYEPETELRESLYYSVRAVEPGYRLAPPSRFCMSALASSQPDFENQRAAATTSFSAEFALLLACCAVGDSGSQDAERRALLERALDWAQVIRLAEHHGVAPLVYQALRVYAGSVPPAVLDELRNRYEHNVRRNLRFTAELFRILDCFEAYAIPAIPLKGPVLAETVYGDLALRDFSDLDVLVHRDDLMKAKAALGALGYVANIPLSETEECAYLATGYEYTFDGPAGKNLLEIQWDILPRFYAVDFDIGEFFARANNINVWGRAVRALSPEDLMLALCVHAAKHAWVRVHWLRDIAGVVETQGLDWTVFERRAAELGIVRMVSVSLRLAQRLLHSNVAESVRSRWTADPEIERLSEDVVRGLSTAETYDAESLRYFRLMMCLRERGSDQLRFLSRLAFTPSLGEWRVVRLPAPLFSLYRVIRMFRLGARVLRSCTAGSR